MGIANKNTYLMEIVAELNKHYPNNHIVNIACHGHSVPAGYFATPLVDTFSSYPGLLHKALKQRFPYAVINVIVTAVGGENSLTGAQRFESEVLCHNPNILTIDYGLNDRGIGLKKALEAWKFMIEKALERNIKLILLTPTWDVRAFDAGPGEFEKLREHAVQIRSLAQQYETGLADSFYVFEQYVKNGGDCTDLLSWVNHPNLKGHEMVTVELLQWFSIRRL